MTLTYRGSVLAGAIFDWLVDPAQMATFGLEYVEYGDQLVIPKLPAVCVEPLTVNREYKGTQFRTLNDLAVLVIVYSGALKDQTLIRREADAKVDQIAEALNVEGLPANMGGTRFGEIITHGWTRSVEYGYAARNKQLIRVGRVMYMAQSLTPLTGEA